MVECDVLTVVLPYIREDFTAVQFKLLGLLRMLCDGQGKNFTENSYRCTVCYNHTYL